MGALGLVVGLSAVLDAMAHAPTQPTVIRGGLDAIAELAADATLPDDIQRLPVILRTTLQILEQTNTPSPLPNCRKKCIAALCSVVGSLAPHAAPGQLHDFDCAVKALFDCLCTESSTEIVEWVVESLGRLALIGTAWREALGQCGIVEALAAKMESSDGYRHPRLLKFCFWAAGAISGLPFVVRKLHSNLQSIDMIDAAFCAMIDILDDDLESDWVLTSVDRCAEADIPSVLRLTTEAMRWHAGSAIIQERGCHCVGLLLELAPAGTAPSDAITVVIAAARRHSRSASVMRSVCGALRALIDAPAVASPDGQQELLAARLREEGVEAIVERTLADFNTTDDVELLEDAIVVLSAISGVDAALKAFSEAGPGPVRTAGVKALFEFGRQHQGRLGSFSGELASAVIAMVEESPGESALHQQAALLLGLCSGGPGA